MAQHPDTVTITWQPPPDELFDAQVDVAATLATNSALLRNAPLARHYTQRWLQFASGPRVWAGNRIALGYVAHFVEAEIHGVDLLSGDEPEGAPRWRAGAAIQGQRQRCVAGGESGPWETSAAGGLGGELTIAAAATAEMGGSAVESPELLARRKGAEQARLKSLRDLFGNRPNRGQNVLQRAGAGDDGEDQLLTLPEDVASLYVVSHLVEASTTRASGEGEVVGGLPGLGEVTWEKQRKRWAEEGLDEKQAARCEGELQVKALRGLPFFVLKNGGTYYSSTMLKYILGLESHAYCLFRDLRDVNRGKERARLHDSEGASADDSEGDSSVEGAAQLRFDRQLGEWEAKGQQFILGQDVQTSALSADGGDGELGGAGGANDAEAGTSAEVARREGGGARRSLAHVQRTPAQKMQLVLRAAAANTPAELASVLAASTKAFGLPFVETATVAEMQVGQSAGPEDADQVWCALVKEYARQLQAAGEGDREPEEVAEEAGAREAGKAGEAGEAGEKKGSEVEDPKDFTNIEGEVLEEEYGWRRLKWGAKAKRSYDIAPAATAAEEWIDEGEAEEDEWVVPGEESGLRTERPGLDPRAAFPFRGLDNIGRYWPDFSVPDQVVTMQASYDAELEARFQGRHNLWVLGAISRLFPQSVPIKKSPGSETLFAVELVKEAYREMKEDAAPMGMAALAALEGVEVTPELRRGGDSLSVVSLVRSARASKRLREGEAPEEVLQAEWADLDEEERMLGGEVLKGVSVRGKKARAEIAMRAADEDLRRLQPDILDEAGSKEGEEESEGQESEEES